MAEKVRAHMLAKELGVSSKIMVEFLQEHGIFVRSASSTLEASAVRLVRDKTAAGAGPGNHRGGGAPTAPENPRTAAMGEPSPQARDAAAMPRPDYRHDESSVFEEVSLLRTREVFYAEIIEEDSLGAPKPGLDFPELEEDPIEPDRGEMEEGAGPDRGPFPDNAEQLKPLASRAPITDPVPVTHRFVDAAPNQHPAQDMEEPIDATGQTPDGNPRHPLPRRKPVPAAALAPEQGFLEFQRGDTGVSFEALLVPYLVGATEITITDPYVRTLHQTKTLMELLEALLRAQEDEAMTAVHLRTSKDWEGDAKKDEAQKSYLDRVQSAFQGTALTFTYSLEPGLHGRTIMADSGWRISLDRGLDIFDRVPADPLNLGHRMQEHRTVKSFYVTYHRLEPKN